MTTITIPSGVNLEYETFGDKSDPALLLVSGFTAQLTSWHEGFCQILADAGRYVIRFDNRDCGLSQKFDDAKSNIEAVMLAMATGGEMPPVPYTLSDMAVDGIGLLTALGIERAHVAGASMGGMIVQTMAIEHPERLLSATSIMSTIGDRAYGQADEQAMAVLIGPPPTNREEAVLLGKNMEIWSSKRYFDAEASAIKVAESWDRAPYTAGGPRQLAAIFASGDRTEALTEVQVPMLVIHGHDDTLINISGGRRTAELVPGANLVELADMGHDLPEPLWPMITGAMLSHQEVAAIQGVAS